MPALCREPQSTSDRSSTQVTFPNSFYHLSQGARTGCTNRPEGISEQNINPSAAASVRAAVPKMQSPNSIFNSVEKYYL